MDFAFIYAVQVLTAQTVVLHTGFLFGNPGVYAKNKHQKKGQWI